MSGFYHHTRYTASVAQSPIIVSSSMSFTIDIQGDLEPPPSSSMSITFDIQGQITQPLTIQKHSMFFTT